MNLEDLLYDILENRNDEYFVLYVNGIMLSYNKPLELIYNLCHDFKTKCIVENYEDNSNNIFVRLEHNEIDTSVINKNLEEFENKLTQILEIMFESDVCVVFTSTTIHIQMYNMPTRRSFDLAIFIKDFKGNDRLLTDNDLIKLINIITDEFDERKR